MTIKTPRLKPGSRGIARLAVLACLLALALPGGAQTTAQTAIDRSIRPFKVQVPQASLDDLRRRIAATRWPDKETVADQSQGAPQS